MTEELTKDIVRSKLKESISLGWIIEPEKSNNILIDKHLKNASKSGKGGQGYPEFILTNTNYPDIVKKLRNEYLDFWKEVSKEHGITSHIVIGNDQVPYVSLSSHDWLVDALPPWNQVHIVKGEKTNVDYHRNVYHIIVQQMEYLGNSVKSHSSTSVEYSAPLWIVLDSHFPNSILISRISLEVS